MFKYTDVFVPGGFPSHTYNPRGALQLEERIREVRENLCKLVTVTGQTKSGKTVLARKTLPPEECIWIDGGTVTEEVDFWNVVIQKLSLFQTTEMEEIETSSAEVGATGTTGANFLVAKGSASLKANYGASRGSGKRSSRTISSRVTALEGLRRTQRPLVIDDFHYLLRSLQGGIVRALKPLIFDGLPVIIIAIPHRRYDALKVEKEMTGRISQIEIPIWSHDELGYIPVTGFRLLGYQLEAVTLARLANEAIGSPHLMQDFCRVLCRARNLVAVSGSRQLPISDVEIDKVFPESRL